MNYSPQAEIPYAAQPDLAPKKRRPWRNGNNAQARPPEHTRPGER